jgi:adenylate kinase
LNQTDPPIPPAAAMPGAMRFRAILLLGAPGSGKGTQGKILGAIPNFYHFACGDVFRHLKPDTQLGRVFLEYSSRGQLVPDEPTVRLWREQIEADERAGLFNPASDTLVLDGIPRNTGQAEILQQFLEVRLVLYFTCSDMSKLIVRLQSRALRENRLDDANVEIIRRRLEVFESQTRPLLDFYGLELLRKIDATQTPVKVLSDILRAIEELAA